MARYYTICEMSHIISRNIARELSLISDVSYNNGEISVRLQLEYLTLCIWKKDYVQEVY